MELLVFGSRGARVVVFPTRQGRFFDYENWGLVSALEKQINDGCLQLFCVDSIDSESLYCERCPPQARLARHASSALRLTCPPAVHNYREAPLASLCRISGASDRASMNDIALEPALTLSDSAVRRIGRILGKEPAGTALRVSVSGGGCSGFQYGFDLTREREPDDLVIARDGAVVFVDPVSLDYMRGSVIDFVDDLMGQSFQIRNPNAVASCGCGTSFSV